MKMSWTRKSCDDRLEKLMKKLKIEAEIGIAMMTTRRQWKTFHSESSIDNGKELFRMGEHEHFSFSSPFHSDQINLPLHPSACLRPHPSPSYE